MSLIFVEPLAEIGDVGDRIPFLVIACLHLGDGVGVELAPFRLEVIEVVLDLEAAISDDWLFELAVVLFIDGVSEVCAEAIFDSA